MDSTKTKFKHVYRIPPIDIIKSDTKIAPEEIERVLNAMPEEPKDNIVYKMYATYNSTMIPVFMCKTDSDEAIYAFSDKEVIEWRNAEIKEVFQ